jgi:hypothetical protein
MGSGNIQFQQTIKLKKVWLVKVHFLMMTMKQP